MSRDHVHEAAPRQHYSTGGDAKQWWYKAARSHAAADLRSGRDWVCACASCRNARAAGWRPAARRPLWMVEGWKSAGKGLCVCPGCLCEVMTNARARRAHERQCRAIQAIPLHQRRAPGSVRVPHSRAEGTES